LSLLQNERLVCRVISTNEKNLRLQGWDFPLENRVAPAPAGLFPKKQPYAGQISPVRIGLLSTPRRGDAVPFLQEIPMETRTSQVQ